MIRAKSFAVAAWLVLSGLALAVSAGDNKSLDVLIDELAREVHKDGLGKTGSIVGKIAKLKDPAAIPKLIGIIDSDNSSKTIYGVGSFGLGPLTGVKHDELHHGPWWKKWWAENKKRFPKEVQEIPIPTFPLTQQGREFAANLPAPDSVILEPTADDYLARIKSAIETGNHEAMATPCDRLAKLGDERAIPKLIGLMDADNSPFVIERIGGIRPWPTDQRPLPPIATWKMVAGVVASQQGGLPEAGPGDCDSRLSKDGTWQAVRHARRRTTDHSRPDAG